MRVPQVTKLPGVGLISRSGSAVGFRRGELDGLQRPPVSETSKAAEYGDLDRLSRALSSTVSLTTPIITSELTSIKIQP